MSFRQRVRSSNGSALVELAVVMPVLVLTFVGVGDFSRLFYKAIELSDAARAGAQYGAFDNAHFGDTTKIKASAVAAGSNIGLTTTDVTVTRPCQCATDDGATFAAAASCTAVCPSGQHLVIYLTVTTTKSFSTVMANVPGVPSTVTLTRTASMRLAN